MMKLWKKRRNEFVLLGGATPVIAIIVIKAVAPIDGPRAASAGSQQFDIPAVKTFETTELTDTQRVLSQMITPEDEPEHRPFLETAVNLPDEFMIQAPDGSPGADVEYVEQLTVTSILNGKRPVAVIGGKPRQIDDRLDHGWWISDISASTFRVTLSHTYHGNVVLRIRHEMP